MVARRGFESRCAVSFRSHLTRCSDQPAQFARDARTTPDTALRGRIVGPVDPVDLGRRLERGARRERVADIRGPVHRDQLCRRRRWRDRSAAAQVGPRGFNQELACRAAGADRDQPAQGRAAFRIRVLALRCLSVIMHLCRACRPIVQQRDAPCRPAAARQVARRPRDVRPWPGHDRVGVGRRLDCLRAPHLPDRGQASDVRLERRRSAVDPGQAEAGVGSGDRGIMGELQCRRDAGARGELGRQTSPRRVVRTQSTSLVSAGSSNDGSGPRTSTRPSGPLACRRSSRGTSPVARGLSSSR